VDIMKQKNYIKWVFVVLICFISSSGFAQKEVFEKANNAYKLKNYSEAVSLYLSIYEQDKTSVELCYNLGNSYFKQNEFAKAILWYERAKRLDATNEDVDFNLNVARLKIVDKIEKKPTIFLVDWWWNFVFMFSATNWTIISIIFFAIFLSLVALLLFSNSISMRKWSFSFALSAFVLFVVFSISAWSHWSIINNESELIVLEPSCNVKSSPDENSTLLFVIHEGIKVVQTDEVGAWIEIKLDNDTKGWIKKTHAEVI